MSKKLFKLHELVTRSGQDIHRIKEISEDGLSGVFECVYSESSMYEVGESEGNLLSRYNQVTAEEHPHLASAISMNSLHLHLTHEGLAEIIRQAYLIGQREANIPGLTLAHRVHRIYTDINWQLQKGPLTYFTQEGESSEPWKSKWKL